ncbi:hypothetical protein [Sulfuriroseicoccus oceanibius]|uniref:Uncharacterized protein n=1 Tax=Sulfuriroseicoccus oceanibius TaxID=2707525 RepID=A0A6B3LBU6_9BACT|nr:hypothetical protein [Sulfuriroseicoccus oceanibius]QQL45786.1 hypothetical protein G3M56_004160 [Sulfuriroseicoccus oceanibius]
MPGSEISTIPLLCNQCGASLKVAENTNFAHCSYCNSQLKVHRSGGAVFSEVVAEIKERQDETDNRVRILELENQILRLDQRWDQMQEQFMIHPKNGRPYLPDEKSAAGGILMIPFALIFGIVAISMAGEIGFLFLLIAVAAAVASTISSNNKRKEYQAAKFYHERRKADLRTQIQRLRSPIDGR